ncbi:unnamed protein product [Polarella glacialis]|uniref:Uncharacterized protein n=1 Tax=Polarella glacialis TaxID=89957 RepID=A0A813JHK7_POLGL|nr:unnamed protein product [Polarella glacialis]
MASPQKGLQWAVACLTWVALVSETLSLVLVPAAFYFLFREMTGLGDILCYRIRFEKNSWQQWWRGRLSSGHWSRWVLYMQDIEGTKGFLEAQGCQKHSDTTRKQPCK